MPRNSESPSTAEQKLREAAQNRLGAQIVNTVASIDELHLIMREGTEPLTSRQLTAIAKATAKLSLLVAAEVSPDG